MRLSWEEVRRRAALFAKDWASAGYEKGEAQSVYNDFFQCFGVNRRQVAVYEGVDVYVNVSHTPPVPSTRPLPAEPQQFGIADLAAEFAVTPRAIRFYEDEGLIAPTRTGTQRIYSRADRARLAWILRAKRVGFSIADIREMISLYDLGDGRRTQRRVTIEKCRERVRALTAQRQDIDATIKELTDFIVAVEAAAPRLREV